MAHPSQVQWISCAVAITYRNSPRHLRVLQIGAEGGSRQNTDFARSVSTGDVMRRICFRKTFVLGGFEGRVEIPANCQVIQNEITGLQSQEFQN